MLSNNFVTKRGNVSVENSTKHRIRRNKAEMKIKTLSKEEEKIMGKQRVFLVFPPSHLNFLPLVLGMNTALVQDIIEKTGKMAWTKQNETIEEHKENKNVHH